MSVRKIVVSILLVVVVISLSVLAWIYVFNESDAQSQNNIPDQSEIVFSDTNILSGSSLSGDMSDQEMIPPLLVAIPTSFITPQIQESVKDENVRLIPLPDDGYRERALSLWLDDKIDIALVDSLFVQDFSQKIFAIEFDESVYEKFLPSLQIVIKKGFVPFGIDPIVFAMQNALLLSPDRYTLEQLDEYISQLIQGQESDLPLVGLGVDSLLLAFWESDRREDSSAFFFTIYELLRQWHRDNDIYARQNFLDRQRDTRSILRSTDECGILCLTEQGDMRVSVLWYSEWQQKKEEYGLKETSLLGFPDYDSNTPMRAWGWIINKETTQLIPSLLLINTLISAESMTPNSLLPVTRREFSALTAQNEYVTLKAVNTEGYVLWGGSAWQKNFLLYSGIQDVIQGGYNPQLWLKDPSWDF